VTSRGEPGAGTTTVTDDLADRVELKIGGMSCAACAARIEKKLNRLEGTTATVNYATEKAMVLFTAPITPDDLVAAVVKAGYTADLVQPPLPRSESPGVVGDPPTPGPDAASRRLLISTVLAAPVIAMSMTPALQFVNWQWLSLTLAARPRCR
jgi:Cu+-exporting ATPase